MQQADRPVREGTVRVAQVWVEDPTAPRLTWTETPKEIQGPGEDTKRYAPGEGLRLEIIHDGAVVWSRTGFRADMEPYVDLVNKVMLFQYYKRPAAEQAILDQISRARDVATRYGMIEGGHHKQWVIDQMLREILGNRYAAWREIMDSDPDYEPWDEGVSP